MIDAIQAILVRGVEDLLGRASGPLHFRLFMMPIVVTTLGIRAGLRDARAGKPTFAWAMLTRPTDRPHLLRSAVRDIGRVLIMAFVLDTIYQLAVLRDFKVVQLLIVVIALAILPYTIVRSLTIWVAGAWDVVATRRTSR